MRYLSSYQDKIMEIAEEICDDPYSDGTFTSKQVVARLDRGSTKKVSQVIAETDEIEVAREGSVHKRYTIK